MTLEVIRDHLAGRLDEYLADLETLVNLDCGTHNKAGVDRAAGLMRERLGRAGFTVHTLPLDAYGDCLQATMTGPGTLRLLLLGHTDTVYPDGTAAQRPMTQRAGRIIGPGANDMKAGLLTGVYAVEALLAGGWEDFAEITFFCNSEEEIGSPVSSALYADAARRADAALVLEAARENGDIVSARKGGGLFRVMVTGHSAHAGVEPHKGANALHQLSHHVQALQALNGLLPGTTVTVGVAKAGTVSNVVPDLATADVDLRVTHPEDIPVVEDALRRALHWTHVPGTTTTYQGSFGAYPMAKTPAIALMADLARQTAAELDIDLVDEATGGVSDANKVAAFGTPVLDGLGPIGGLDHNPGEYVELASIVPRTTLLAGLIAALGRERERLAALSAAG